MAWLAIGCSFLAVSAEAVAAEGAAAPVAFRVTTFEDLDGPGWKLDDPAVRDEVERIRQAAPAEPAVKPARPRKLLVYGRKETHPPVPRCFVALEAMGRKSGAFETVWSGDPAAVLPENLRQFDAIVMNNTHEGFPFMPRDFRKLPEEEQAKLREQEAACQKSLLEFVSGGKGLVGLHAANAGVKWPEYVTMIGGQLESYLLSGKGYWIRNLEPKHPLCAGAPAVFEVNDEVYGFNTPADTNPSFSRDRVRVLLELDRGRVTDAATLSKSGKEFDYAVSWVKPHGQGRVFYCSLGHWPDAFVNPYILRHWLAGIQFALGDLEAPAEPPAKK